MGSENLIMRLEVFIIKVVVCSTLRQEPDRTEHAVVAVYFGSI